MFTQSFSYMNRYHITHCALMCLKQWVYFVFWPYQIMKPDLLTFMSEYEIKYGSIDFLFR